MISTVVVNNYFAYDHSGFGIKGNGPDKLDLELGRQKSCILSKKRFTEEKRETIRYVQQKYATSASRTCRVLGLARSTIDYQEHPRDDSEVLGALEDLAGKNKRFGHPRLFILLKPEKKIHVNHKRRERIYQSLGLQIKNKRRKKLGSNGRKVEPIPPLEQEMFSQH